MTELDLAYMAGIFDGEGCITIQRGSQRGKRHYTLRCLIGICNPYIPYMFKFAFGGWVYQWKSKKENHGMVGKKVCGEAFQRVKQN